MSVRDYPTELRGTVDPVLYRRLEQLFQLIYELQQAQREVPVRTQQFVRQQLQMLGVLREPLVGAETPDPFLSTAATVPGAVTDLTGTSSGNVTVTVTSSGPGNSAKNIQVTFSNNPLFNSVNVTSHYEVAGTQVVGPQGTAIANSDGTQPDDTRAINEMLAFLRSWGSIAT